MSLDKDMLDALKGHWAVGALRPETFRDLASLVRSGRPPSGEGLRCGAEIATAATAFEIVAVEGLEDLWRDGGSQAAKLSSAAAALAFEARRMLPERQAAQPRSWRLRTAMIGACGARWAELDSWCRGSGKGTLVPGGDPQETPGTASWEEHVRNGLESCWMHLLGGRARADAKRICRVVDGFRFAQEINERESLAAGSGTVRLKALRIAALYNWAKATEEVARLVAGCPPHRPKASPDKFWNAAILAASRSGGLELDLSWARAASACLIARVGRERREQRPVVAGAPPPIWGPSGRGGSRGH